MHQTGRACLRNLNKHYCLIPGYITEAEPHPASFPSLFLCQVMKCNRNKGLWVKRKMPCVSSTNQICFRIKSASSAIHIHREHGSSCLTVSDDNILLQCCVTQTEQPSDISSTNQSTVRQQGMLKPSFSMHVQALISADLNDHWKKVSFFNSRHVWKSREFTGIRDAVNYLWLLWYFPWDFKY